MSDVKVKNMIKSFFENDVSKELRLQFYHWFVGSTSFGKTKEDMMLELWENTPSETEEDIFERLKEVQLKMKSDDKVPVFHLYAIILRVAAIFILPIVGSIVTYILFDKHSNIVEIDIVETYVPIGQTKQVLLSDDTEVTLKEGTLLLYPTVFNGAKRDVILTGEAKFNVAKNPEKPFTVKTKYLGVTALGTIFNVSAFPDSKVVSTILEEGKVKVKTTENNNVNEILLPNEQIIYNDNTESYVKNVVNSRQLEQENRGGLTFQSETFKNIVKALEQKYNVVVNYEDGRFANKRLTVHFSEDESLDTSLKIITKMIPGTHYRIVERNVYIN